MSHDLNAVTIVGTVADDPRLHQTTNSQVLNLRVETTSRFAGKDGQMRDSRQFHTIVVWGKRAERLAHLRAGDRVHAEGELRSSSYEKDGVTKWKTEIQASAVCQIGDTQRAPWPTELAPKEETSDDDLPF